MARGATSVATAHPLPDLPRARDGWLPRLIRAGLVAGTPEGGYYVNGPVYRASRRRRIGIVIAFLGVVALLAALAWWQWRCC